MSEASSSRPTPATDAAVSAEFDALSAASKAAVDMQGARDIAAKTLNLASLTRPFDCTCARARACVPARVVQLI